jgi:very-short-patch-repair endonuclease
VRCGPAFHSVVERQLGVFSRAQALGAGMSREMIRRRLRAGEWVRCHAGVYRLAGAPRSWEQKLVAACLAGSGAASHRAAAALLRLDGFASGVVEISTPRRISPPGVIVHRVSLPPEDVAFRGAIPATTAARTLVDLCAVAPPRRVELALEDALRRRLVTVASLTEAVERIGRQGRRGVGRLARLLEDAPATRPAESALEIRLIRLLEGAGLPPPQRQCPVYEGEREVARIDLAYPRARLAIEADGYRWHSGRATWQRDLSRQNLLVLRGWTVLRFTWDDVVHRGDYVVAEVARALEEKTRMRVS